MAVRYYYRRGERLPLNELDGVKAVNLVDDQFGDTIEEGDREVILSASLDLRDDAGPVTVSSDEVEAFESSGWTFVVDDTDTAERSAARAAGGAPVFQTEEGQTMIGTASITMQFVPDMSAADARRLAEQLGLVVVRELRFAPNQFEVEADGDALETANELQIREDVVYAELTFIEAVGRRLTPSDPAYGRQWHLANPGTAVGATEGADISAEDAWDYGRGRGVRIAVIDNGFDVDHPDLEAAVTGQSGFFDLSGRYRQTLVNYPDTRHGTFCAGMAGARQNNGVDGSGSAPEADLTLIATQVDQVGTQATLARAVAYASDPSTEVDDADPAAGADVISCSLGPPTGARWRMTSVLENALRFAAQRGRRGLGTPVLWAVSNANVNIQLDEVVSFPSVIAVGRSTVSDRRGRCAQGAALDFVAPGVNVVSSASGGGMRTSSGTSFATPLAAGVAALVLGINPKLRAEAVRDILRQSCDKVGGVTYNGAGHHPSYGHGRVNALAAVMDALQTLTNTTVHSTDADGDRRAEIQISSPWGIGTLDLRGSSLTTRAIEPNGSRLDGWVLDTSSNDFQLHGDFVGGRADESLVTSPWGVGLLAQSSGTYRAVMLKPNGTAFGGWRLNTANDRFGPSGWFSRSGKRQILVRSPWGIGVLQVEGDTMDAILVKPNGTAFDGWRLSTINDRFGPVGDFDNDGLDELLVRSGWGMGLLKVERDTMRTVVSEPNGTSLGGWRLNTERNWFGPVGDFDGDGTDELVIISGWGLGLLKLDGGSFRSVSAFRNGSSLGGWRLNTYRDRVIGIGDFDGDGRPELVITSRWGIGVLGYDPRNSGFEATMLRPNGTRFGNWLLDTDHNQFHVVDDLTGDGRANLVVESPWGLGVLAQAGSTFEAVTMAPNGTRFGEWLLDTSNNLVVAG